MAKLSKKVLDEKIEKLISLKKEINELQNSFDSIKDELKTVMDKNGVEELKGNKLYCYYKTITRQVIDNDKLKANNLYEIYLKDSESKQFNYNVIK